MKATEDRKHHYVPQFLLRNFSEGATKLLHVFDKRNQREFKVAIKDAAAETGFNASTWEGQTLCIEEFYTEVEDLASPILRAVVEGNRLPEFSPKEKVLLSRFLAAQLIRTKARREINAQLGVHLRMMAESEGSLEFKQWAGEYDPEKEKFQHLKDTESLVHDLSHALIYKDILLFERNSNSRFLIGDNPLITHNTLNQSEFRGTTGLQSKSVEVYLPLSPSLLLGFFCPSIKEDFKRAVLAFGRGVNNFILDYLIAVNDRNNIGYEEQNVVFINSLQIRDSERFVYSSDGHFDLAREMLRNNRELSRGPRMTIFSGGVKIQQEDLDEWSSKEGKRSRG